MDEKKRIKEQWLLSLQSFLSSRLRTPSYLAAAQSRPLISLPSMVPHTQYLVDGIVWSLNDHAEWASEAWLVVQNHIKSMADRLHEVSNDLAAMSNSIKEFEQDVCHTREWTYRAHSAVQDLYLAFCVIDAVLKNCHSQKKSLKLSIEKMLPQLVVEVFPIFQNYSQSIWIDSATEEFRLLFLDFLRSWTTGGHDMVEDETNRRLEGHIQRCLRTHRDAAHASIGATSSSALCDSLRIVLDGNSALSLNPLSSTGMSVDNSNTVLSLSPVAGEKKIRSFLFSIYPNRRAIAARLRCAHCGAPLRDDASKTAHYRIHFHAHNFLKPELKMVRLTYPSVTEFIDYAGDVDRRGYFAKVVDVLEEVYKHDGQGALKLRRMEDLPEAS